MTKYYDFSIHKFYKIWFSSDTQQFLGIENELRLVRMRTLHEDIVIYLIYSSKLLNSNAVKDLHAFCERYRIIPIDFDTQLLELLTEENDIKIYNLAKLEIENYQNKNFGNLAAASDGVRVISTVIKEYGIYSDFDVHFDLSSFQNQIIKLEAPVLLNMEILDFKDKVMISPNSDFLAYSIVSSNPNELTTESLLVIQNLQETAIKNYEFPYTSEIMISFKRNEFPQHDYYERFFNTISEHKPVDIFSFRKMFNAFINTIDSEKRVNYRFVTIAVVMSMAGPFIYRNMYKQLSKESTPFFLDKDCCLSSFFDMSIKSSIDYYPFLSKCIELTNRMSSSKARKSVSDSSWTDEGGVAKKNREQQIVQAGSKLISF